MSLSPSERHRLPEMGIPKPEDVEIPEDLAEQLLDSEWFRAARLALMDLVRVNSVPPIKEEEAERYLVGIHVAIEAAELLAERTAATADTQLEMVE